MGDTIHVCSQILMNGKRIRRVLEERERYNGARKVGRM